MNTEYEKGKEEFENKNFTEALAHFDNVGPGDDDYEQAQFYTATCLMELKEYEDALKVSESIISRSEFSKFAWFNKVLCLIFLNEDDGALKAMDDVLKIVDMDDKYDLVFIAKAYKLLLCYEDALKYCNMALEIDDEFKDALFEKSLISLRINDFQSVGEVSDKLLSISEGGALSLIPVFLLKLFSKEYSLCLDLVKDDSFNELGDETIEMLKAIVYKQICEDYSINLLVHNDGDLSTDEALGALIDFVENGNVEGNIKGVQYYIF